MEVLSYIASALVKSLYMDKDTENGSRLLFAKICDEMDLSTVERVWGYGRARSYYVSHLQETEVVEIWFSKAFQAQ